MIIQKFAFHCVRNRLLPLMIRSSSSVYLSHTHTSNNLVLPAFYNIMIRNFKLSARRSKQVEDVDDLVPKTGDGWVTISFGNDENKVDLEMEERIRQAQEWLSRPLPKKEREALNKRSIVDKVIMDEGREPMPKGKGSKYSDKPRDSDKKPRQATHEKLLSASLTSTETLARKIKGFLQMNPFVCSGCGTSFQAKREDEPGYLPPEKFAIYRKQAILIRAQQEAVRILDMAGVELGSRAAEELLRQAKISEEVIRAIQAMGASLKQDTEESVDIPVSKEGMAPKDREWKSPLEELLMNNLGGDMNGQVSAEILQKLRVNAQTASSNVLEEMKEVEQPTTNEESNDSTQAILSRLTRRKIHAIAAEEGVTNSEARQASTPRNDVQTDAEVSEQVCICQRCYRLQQYGQVEQSLRPGWSNHELLTPEHFESLLSKMKDTETVVLCLLDIFDLEGSILRNLKQIVGPNPIVIAVNKIDLLPKDVSHTRVIEYIYSEVRRLTGLMSPKEYEAMAQENYFRHQRSSATQSEFEGVLKRGHIHLMSCTSGFGMDKLLNDVMSLAENYGNTIHVMGAANVGKSSFINYILDPERQFQNKRNHKKSSTKIPLVTVSNLPGTTLDFLKIKLPNGMTMIDTPGLIKKGHLTTKLTPEELKQVIPRTPINAVTLRLEIGKAVLMGGLATIEQLEGKPFFFTFFLSNEIKLHRTDSEKISTFLQTHLGKLVFPPASLERYEAIGPYQSHDFTVDGEGWHQSSNEIVIDGLGWIALTGTGDVKVRVTAPKDSHVHVRSPALLPFESKSSTAKFTGGKIVKKSKKSNSSGYGWRA